MLQPRQHQYSTMFVFISVLCYFTFYFLSTLSLRLFSTLLFVFLIMHVFRGLFLIVHSLIQWLQSRRSGEWCCHCYHCSCHHNQAILHTLTARQWNIRSSTLKYSCLWKSVHLSSLLQEEWSTFLVLFKCISLADPILPQEIQLQLCKRNVLIIIQTLPIGSNLERKETAVIWMLS